MKQGDLKFILGIIAATLIYSLSAFAYLNATYVSRDSFSRLCSQIDNIEHKLDRLIGFGRQ